MLTTGLNSGYINGAVAQGPVGSKAAVTKPESFFSWVVKSVIGTEDQVGYNQLRVSNRDSNELRQLHAA